MADHEPSGTLLPDPAKDCFGMILMWIGVLALVISIVRA